MFQQHQYPLPPPLIDPRQGQTWTEILLLFISILLQVHMRRLEEPVRSADRRFIIASKSS